MDYQQFIELDFDTQFKYSITEYSPSQLKDVMSLLIYKTTDFYKYELEITPIIDQFLKMFYIYDILVSNHRDLPQLNITVRLVNRCVEHFITYSKNVANDIVFKSHPKYQEFLRNSDIFHEELYPAYVLTNKLVLQ